MTIVILTAILVAFGVVQWVYFKTLKIAKEKELVDNPDARKLQKEPVPVMGGIAVFLGLVAGILAGKAAWTLTSGAAASYDYMAIPVICGMIVMLYIGALDDIIGLSPRTRFIAETLVVAAICVGSGESIDNFHGLWGIYEISWWYALPLTIVAGVGIINALNMIDGVNGLSSGLCIVCSTLFGIIFAISGDVANAALAFALASSLLPFMIHNVFGQRSRMFIGDAGTMVMGTAMTWFVIRLLSSEGKAVALASEYNLGLVALALAILAVPVFDTLRVMSMRILHKKNPFSPDKTHLHHVFIRVGVSHFITANTEIFIDLLVVAACIIAAACGASIDLQLYIVIATAFVLVCGTYVFIRHHANHHTKFMHRLSHFSVKTHLGDRQWWLKITHFLDSPEGESTSEVDEEKKAHLSRRFEHADPEYRKQLNRSMIMDYIKDKAEVHVNDIISYSGAGTDEVLPAILDLELSNSVVVITRDKDGNPEIITTPTEV